ncbi:MAG TPA: glycosyltransferase family 4 protein [Chlamydiales bacterium]
MRILHLEASPGWGGQEMRILSEAEGMRKRGHEVFFAVMNGALLGKEALAKGFVVYECNFRKIAWGLTLFHLLKWLFKHKIDLVNTHSSLDAWIGGIAGRIAGKKVLRTRHLSTPVKPGWNSRFVYGTLADFVVTTCASIIAPISKQSGKPLSQFRSIATGINADRVQATEESSAQFRKQLGLDSSHFLVGTACFMRSWKGIDDFLQAADALRHIPDLHWVVIGGGHADRYRSFAKELKLDGIVHFTGHLQNPFPALKALDAFALLSTAHEGVSQAILQAAFLNKPLIATNTGGLGEVCIHEFTGLSVPPFSPTEVAASVLRLKSNASLCSQLGSSARQLVLNEFTFQHTLDGMEEIYRKLLFQK